MTAVSQLTVRREKAVARGISVLHNVVIDRASGAEIWDTDGRRYLDFAGGIAVLNVGHRHPQVVEAVRNQLDRFTHTCFQVVPYEPYIELAERLNRLAPGDSAKKTIFLTTGAEAVENALKIARTYTGRTGVIAFGGSFHGRTHMTMGLTGKIAGYKQGFGPFPSEIHHARYPNALHSVSIEDALEDIERLFRTDIEPGRVAAVIIEPVQGEGGFYVAPAEFLKWLRRLCDRHGILLIADEVQTGIGRTGRFFAIEHSDVEPDLITVAKSLSGGLPLSAVIGRAEIMDAPGPGALGGTFAGNPLSCAAALATLDVIDAEELLARSETIGMTLVAGLSALAERHPFIADVRGVGAMVAFEIMTGPQNAVPDPDTTKAVVAAARNRGLILLPCGFHGNVVRILVPLTASDAQIIEGIEIIGASVAEVVPVQLATRTGT